jgi:uncharacterized protein (TIGR02646 family)
MIRIIRCSEPEALADVRQNQLAVLRALGRAPSSNDIYGYKIVSEELWTSQHHKCCYCEHRIPKGYNDVEHYRPKAFADRRPGCGTTHGYWWLSFTWENLLFACPGCNRSSKRSKFPLSAGGVALSAEELPPGNETPLLIDPSSSVNPVEHIEFVYKAVSSTGGPRHWWARPRNRSRLGNNTIEVCDLNRAELREMRGDHYRDVVVPQAEAIQYAVNTRDVATLKREYERAICLLKSQNAYVGLTYDALRADVSDVDLKALLNKGWPLPDAVGV